MKNRFLMIIFVAVLITGIIPVRAALRIDFFYMLLCDIFVRFEKEESLRELGRIFVKDYLKREDVSDDNSLALLVSSYIKNKTTFEQMLETDPEVKDFAAMRTKSITLL